MEHTLLRYNKGMAVDQSQEHPSDEQKESSQPVDVNTLKEEYLRLSAAYMRLNGKDLDGLSFKELQQLEHQLSEGILSVKEQKEQILLEQLKRSRLQEQKAILENETLRKQVEELIQKTSSNLLEFNPLQRRFSPNSSKADYDCASEEEDDDNDDNDHSDTSLHLGLSPDVGRKRKVAKIEPVSND